MITLVLADDDPIIIQGLSLILESQDDLRLLGAAGNGREAVELCRLKRPDVVLLDIRMPVMDGIDASIQIQKETRSAPLLLTTFDESDLVLKALKADVGGYILKNSPAERILSAIRTVAAGGTVFQKDILEYIRNQSLFPNRDVFSLLTPRELEVVKLVAEGLSNREIAKELCLSEGTVRNYISGILEKTGLEHRTKIAVRYLGGKEMEGRS